MSSQPDCSIFRKAKDQNTILLRSLLDAVLRASIETDPMVFDTGDAPYLKDSSAILADAGLIAILVKRSPTWMKIQLTEEGKRLLTDGGKVDYTITAGKTAGMRLPPSIQRYFNHVSFDLRILFSRNIQKVMSVISRGVVPPLSTDVPTCEGSYWQQYQDREPTMEYVYPMEDGLFGVYRSDGELMPIFFEEEMRWAGPIPFPPNYIQCNRES